MTIVDLHLGRPLHRGALTFFPIWNGRAVPSSGYVLAADSVRVAERTGSPVVGQLVATNTAVKPALLLEGDLLKGGWQHRAANRSTLIPANRSEMIDVSCVEQGRWAGGAEHSATRRRAPFEVRLALRGDQGEVWRRVDRYGARFGRNESGSLLHAADRAKALAHNLVADLRPLPSQCGVLVGLAGQALLLEVVDSPRTFAQLWQPLLQAVALDAVGAPPEPTPGRRARRFVERLLASDVTIRGAAGQGQQMTARNPFVDVRGLWWQSRTVHACALNPRHALVAA